MAAHQRAVHLEQSLQRERVCGNGAAARVAQTTRPASRAVKSGSSPSSAGARGRAIDSVRGCFAGRARGVKRLTASYLTGRPPHLTSRRPRASSDLIGGKAARGRGGRGGSGGVAARPRLASRSRQKLSTASGLPPYLTLPYLTLPSEGANLTANGCNEFEGHCSTRQQHAKSETAGPCVRLRWSSDAQHATAVDIEEGTESKRCPRQTKSTRGQRPRATRRIQTIQPAFKPRR